MKQYNGLRLLLVLAAVCAIAAGCGGGGTTVEAKSTATTTTMGQELMDLDASHKKGLIDDKEYEKAKEAILERYEK